MAYNPKTGKGLGRFYSAEHRAFRAREWRGFRDTFYDFFRWLYLYGFMAAKLGCHPILMVKAMLRYRWMVSYLTAAHMVDRHTMGLRGKELRYAPTSFSPCCITPSSACVTSSYATRPAPQQQARGEAAR